MADVITRVKSNYFRTTDPDRLRALLASVKTDGEPLAVVEKDGEFMFYCQADIQGVLTRRAKQNLEYDPDWADDNPDEAWTMDAFLAELRSLVAPGDACVVKSVGYEAMRALFADAYIVGNGTIGYENFDTVLRQKTRSLLADPKWETVFDG